MIKKLFIGGILLVLALASCNTRKKAYAACRKCYGVEASSYGDSTLHVQPDSMVYQVFTYYSNDTIKNQITDNWNSHTMTTIGYRRNGTKCFERVWNWEALTETTVLLDSTGTRKLKEWKYKGRGRSMGVSF